MLNFSSYVPRLNPPFRRPTVWLNTAIIVVLLVDIFQASWINRIRHCIVKICISLCTFPAQHSLAIPEVYPLEGPLTLRLRTTIPFVHSRGQDTLYLKIHRLRELYLCTYQRTGREQVANQYLLGSVGSEHKKAWNKVWRLYWF